MDAPAGLFGLFVSSFTSATILPGSSEIVLAAVLSAWPDRTWAALAIATVGNTLGGMTTYLLGRIVPRRPVPRHLAWLERWGVWALLGSWIPLIGDALCAGAGWLRLNAMAAALFMALGKFARYAVIAALV